MYSHGELFPLIKIGEFAPQVLCDFPDITQIKSADSANRYDLECLDSNNNIEPSFQYCCVGFKERQWWLGALSLKEWVTGSNSSFRLSSG